MKVVQQYFPRFSSAQFSPAVIALAFTVLAGIPRLLHPALAEYKLDESIAVLNGFAILHGRGLPLGGEGSSLPGASQGPLFYYIVAFLLALGHDPRAVVAAIGAANAVAVGWTFLVIDRAFSRRIALVSSLLFAGSSWDIVYSRKIWPNDLLAPLAVVALGGLFRALDSRTHRPGLGRSWVAVALMGSLNLSAWPLVFVPTLVQTAIPRTRRGRARWWSLAGLVVLLVAAGVEGRTLGVITTALTGRSSHLVIDLSPLGFIVQLVRADAFQFLAGPSYPFTVNARIIDWLSVALCGLLIVGVVAVALRSIARSLRERCLTITPEVLVLLWWIFPAVAAIARPVQVYIHHFLGTFPTQFVLVALGLDLVLRRASTGLTKSLGRLGLVKIGGLGLVRRIAGQKRRRMMLSTLVAVTFAVLTYITQVRTFVLFLMFISAHPAGTFFGVPLRSSVIAARAVQAASVRGSTFLLSQGDLVGVDILPTVLASLTNNASVNNLDAAHTLVFPTDSNATYLVSPNSLGQVRGELVPWQDAGYLTHLNILPGGYGEFGGRPVGSHLPFGWRAQSSTMVDGGRLTGYLAPQQIRPGTNLTVEVAWQVGQPDSRPYRESVFAHLVDDRGQSITSEDFAPLPTVTWYSGQTILNVFRLRVPARASPGRYWIDFGRYRRPGIQPVRFLAPGGAVGPTSIRLGPLAVPPVQRITADLTPARAVFGGQIRLVGWRVRSSPGHLTVDVLWGALRPPASDYTVFVHLLAPNGDIVAQQDAQPLNGQFPTSTWETGNQILDSIDLSLGDLPQSNYRVVLGLYTLSTGQRVAVRGSDSVTLGEFSLPSEASR